MTVAQPAPAETLALAAASRERADAFLKEQTELTRLAIEREQREERLRGWQQVVEHLSGLMKLAFEAVVAIVVVGIGIALATAVWNAGRDKGLVIEAFSVPPDLAAKGLTGEVVAGKVLDRLTMLQVQTQSNRAPSSYVNNWGNDIKVQIPETGVSIGQFYQYLVRWLGHETHISGDIYRDGANPGSGLAVTSRVGGDNSETLHGADDKLDDLITRAAESVYRRTQPYRFAVYLDNQKRPKEAQAIYRVLIAGNNVDDRAWAYIGLSSERSRIGDMAGAAVLLGRAIATKPGILLSYENLANNAGTLQRDEEQLRWLNRAMAIEARGSDPSMDADDFALNVVQDRGTLAGLLGDFQAELQFNRQSQVLPAGNGNVGNTANQRNGELATCAALHDRACFDAASATLPPADNELLQLNRYASLQLTGSLFGDWDAVVKPGDFMMATLKKLAPLGQTFLERGESPLLAVGYAGKGDFARAHAIIDGTPLDCSICLRTRGRIATMERDWKAADHWYALAVADAPSTPFAANGWGESLLRRGDFAGAMVKFAQAHRLGPRFADPLEGWGEALIATNRADLALARFEEAARYAPNWERLHAQWSRALLYLGRKDEAAVQMNIAMSLDPVVQSGRAQ
jgi:tetratricopeptide (TPR) repeat protein